MESKRTKAAKKGWATRRANKVIKTTKFKVGKKRVEGRKLRVILKTKNFDIVEMQPHVRTVSINGYDFAEEKHFKKRIPLALPFTQYILYRKQSENGGIQLSFSNKPASLTSDVYFPPFPNIYPGSHHTCVEWRSYDEYSDEWNDEVVKGVEDRIAHFWTTWFTPSGSEWLGSVALSDSKLRSYKKWAKMTKKQGLGFILNIDWNYPTQLEKLKKLHGQESESDDYDDPSNW